jgi:hypothetical protein
VTAVEILGRRVELPVEVRVARAAAATFLVPRLAVQRLLEGTGVEPVRLPLGRTLCVIAAVQYVDNDLGAYDEVAVAFGVPRRDGSPAGAFIHQLPVSGEFTLAAGRGIWGFPKWMADISLHFGPHGARCRLEEDGELVLDLQVRRRLIPMPRRSTPMTAYAHLDGVTRRTPFTSHPSGVRAGPAGARLAIGDRHPVARQLRELGLPKRAAASSTIANLAATFGTATPLGQTPR